jgi:hypothetical protein
MSALSRERRLTVRFAARLAISRFGRSETSAVPIRAAAEWLTAAIGGVSLDRQRRVEPAITERRLMSLSERSDGRPVEAGRKASRQAARPKRPGATLLIGSVISSIRSAQL